MDQQEEKEATSFLQRLRKIGAVNLTSPSNKREANEGLALLRDHASEFPAVLKREIEARLPRDGVVPAESSAWELYRAVTSFFLGKEGVNDSQDIPNKAVDTEEQVEIALRFFPHIFFFHRYNQVFPRRSFHRYNQVFPRHSFHRYTHPLEMMVGEAQALSFIPVLARVSSDLVMSFVDDINAYGKEINSIKYKVRTGTEKLFRIHGDRDDKDVIPALRALLDLELLLDKFRDSNLASTKTWELDISESIIRHSLMFHFVQSLLNGNRDVCCIELRLQLLIEVMPNLLKRCSSPSSSNGAGETDDYDENERSRFTRLVLFGETQDNTETVSYHETVHNDETEISGTSLLGLFGDHFCRNFPPNEALRLFRYIVQRGLSNFPNELGFIFYQDALSKWCEHFENKAIEAIVQEELAKDAWWKTHYTSSNSSIKNVMVEVAASNEVPLDGVYMLLRSDPIAAMPMPSLVQQLRRQAKRPNHRFSRQEGKQQVMLLRQHKREFPAAIRQHTILLNRPSFALESIYAWESISTSAKNLVLGNTGSYTPFELCRSLKRKFATEDEFETTLRFFPEIVFELHHCNRTFFQNPIAKMMRGQSVPFLRVLVDVSAEIIKSSSCTFHQCNMLVYTFQALAIELLVRCEDDFGLWDSYYAMLPFLNVGSSFRSTNKTLFADSEWCEKGELHRAENDILEHGFVSNFLQHLVESKDKVQRRGVGFISRRLNILIGWMPSLLKRCCTRNHQTLLELFLDRFWKQLEKDDALELFGVIVELGLKYFPDQQGFVVLKNGTISECYKDFDLRKVERAFYEKVLAWDKSTNNVIVGSPPSPMEKMSALERLLCSKPVDEGTEMGMAAYFRCGHLHSSMIDFSKRR